MGCTQGLIRFFYSVTARRRISMVEALCSAPTSKTKFQRRYGCRNLGGFETTFSPKNIEISWDVFGWKCQQLHQHVSQRSMAPRWLYVSGKQARFLPFLHAIPHSEQLFIEKYNTTSALRLGPSSLWRKRHEFLKSMIVSSAGREYLECVYFEFYLAREARGPREGIVFKFTATIAGPCTGVNFGAKMCLSKTFGKWYGLVAYHFPIL